MKIESNQNENNSFLKSKIEELQDLLY